MKTVSYIAASIGYLCLTSMLVHAQDTASLLVLSKADHTLAIVDPASLKVEGKAPVGDDPHEVIASSDGKLAYVSNYGSGTLNTLAVIDLTTTKALPSIDLGALHGPHGLTYVGGKTWFTVEGSKAIGSYDPQAHKVDWILGTGQNRTHMIYVSADQKQIITTNVSSGSVSIMELGPLEMPGGPHPPGMPPPPAGGRGPGGPPRMDWNETVVKVGNGSEGFDLSPDHTQVWTANSQDGTISVVDIASKKVIETIAANISSANRLKFTPDGSHVLVSLLASPDLVILDAHTRKVVKRVPIGHGAAGILMEPGGARAFVACTPDNYVAVIDLHSLTVTGHILAGGEPDGLAWAVHP